MDDKKRNVLKAAASTIEKIIQKADTENSDFLKEMDLPDAQKKIMLESMERFEKEIHKYLIALRKKYKERIGDLPDAVRKGRKKIKKASKFDAGGKLTSEAIDGITEILGQYIFVDDDKEVDQLEELYDAFADDFFKKISNYTASVIKGSKAKQGVNLTEKAMKWLDSHKIKFAKEVTQTTHDSIISILKKGIADGKGMNSAASSLVELLPDFFNMKDLERRRKLLGDLKSPDLFNALQDEIENDISFQYYRARRIARTEMLSANGAATLEGYRQSRVVVGKEWMCSMDDDSRKWHKSADGQIVPVDEPFIVGGEKLMHPGDSSMGASAKNVIHCRCTMRPKLRYEEKGKN